MPMAEYIARERDDGLPADPWMRVHSRLGATTLGICPGSMRIEGSIQEWSSWTGMTFPASGEYEVSGALVPVVVDLKQDSGLYIEPNVWMRHSVG